MADFIVELGSVLHDMYGRTQGAAGALLKNEKGQLIKLMAGHVIPDYETSVKLPWNEGDSARATMRQSRLFCDSLYRRSKRPFLSARQIQTRGADVGIQVKAHGQSAKLLVRSPLSLLVKTQHQPKHQKQARKQTDTFCTYSRYCNCNPGRGLLLIPGGGEANYNMHGHILQMHLPGKWVLKDEDWSIKQ